MDATTERWHELISNARARCQQVQREFPGMPTLVSIERQLDYLLGLLRGEHNDRSRLRDIILGVQAAREVEPLDRELAKMLFEVSSIVRLTRLEPPKDR